MTTTNTGRLPMAHAAGALVVMLQAPQVLAAEITTAAESSELPVGWSDVAGLGGSLALVIAAVVLVGWLYAKSQGLRGAASGAISVVAAQALGPKERIVLVEVGGKQIVVGMTAQQVQTLHVFDEPVVSSDQPQVAGTVFAAKLRGALRGAVK